MKKFALLLIPAAILLQSCIVSEDSTVDPKVSEKAQSSAQLTSSSSATENSSSSEIVNCYADTDCADGYSCVFLDYVGGGTVDTTVSTPASSGISNDMMLVARPGVCIQTQVACPMIYAPVCANGITYSNTCMAEAAGVDSSAITSGECGVIVNPDTTLVDTLNSILLDRAGGGQIHLFTLANDTQILVTVTAANFSPTLQNIAIAIDSSNIALAQAIRLQWTRLNIVIEPMPIIVYDTFVATSGSSSDILAPTTDIMIAPPSIIETGTWLNIYGVKDGIQTAITDSATMATIDQLETLVREKLVTATPIGL